MIIQYYVYKTLIKIKKFFKKDKTPKGFIY
jgi:hypothetical protein